MWYFSGLVLNSLSFFLLNPVTTTMTHDACIRLLASCGFMIIITVIIIVVAYDSLATSGASEIRFH